MKKLNYLLWNGDIKIYQEEDQFKFSIDTILLAKFVTLNKTAKNILDIGTGTAPIPLILAKRSNAKIVGIEIQKKSFELAEENVKINGLEDQINIINDDINIVSKQLDNNFFDVIVTNPPYFKKNSFCSANNYKKIARSEISLSLDDIFKSAKKLLKDKGRIALVNRPERLSDIISIMKKYGIEPKKIQFVYPKITKKAKLVLIEGIKNGNSELNVLEPIIIHNDDNSYSKEFINILS